jgi:hypothetical protein
MVTATILVLVLWLAFVWIFDLDGFRDTAQRMRRRNYGSPRSPKPTITSGSTRDV